MKILHSSDWHLGKRLDHYSRLPEQKEVLNEICDIADKEQVDLVLLAGDMFDNFNPSTEAINLYYTTLKRLSNNGQRAVVLIAGNHDSADLIEAVDPLARTCGIITAGYPNSKPDLFELDTGLKLLTSDDGFIEIILPKIPYPIRILLTPYANEKRLKKHFGTTNEEQEMRDILSDKWKNISDQYCDTKGVNLLLSHLFFTKKGNQALIEPDGEKPILHIGGAQAIYTNSIPPTIQYVALGHLHRKQIVDDTHMEIVYCGSPIAYSFSETDQDKFIMLIEADPSKKIKSKPIRLNKGKRLLRGKFEIIEKAINWLKENQNALIELTIVSESYLAASDRKQLYDAHEGIINIIPEMKNINNENNTNTKNINLNQNMEQLFTQYFKHKHHQQPNEEIMNLLKEVIAVADNNTNSQ